MDTLPQDHFLSLPRPDVTLIPATNVTDTSTLAAHDFDVDTRTGFMPPQPPLTRLPEEWEQWEVVLDDAIAKKLRLGDTNPSAEDVKRAESWRARVRQLPILATTALKVSELLLRRAHKVLAWTMHFYVHSLPPDVPVNIPPPITIPLLQVSAQLQLPPVLTYSDDVLYNWSLINPNTEPQSTTLTSNSTSPDPLPSLTNLRCQTLFTSTMDESEFYLCAARMELRGVEALELMRATMDEIFVGDAIAVRRTTDYLHRMASVIRDLKGLLLAVREGCDPDVFHNEIRPWFRGQDSDLNKRIWNFEGLSSHPELERPTELSGPSAGQSSLIHSLDVFLGVDKYSHGASKTGETTSPEKDSKTSFLSRMQQYMPRHHRAFLNHLSADPRPLRGFVLAASATSEAGEEKEGQQLLEAYNEAVQALKELRDGHMRIVALYIIGPASRLRQANTVAHPGHFHGAANGTNGMVEASEVVEKMELKGTGGTELAKFLKSVRDRTAGALITMDKAETDGVEAV